MRAVRYPDYWPYTWFSPSVEDVKQAYTEDKVLDADLDSELEWALTLPEPPARAIVDGDEALVEGSGPVHAETLEALDELDVNHEMEQAHWFANRRMRDGIVKNHVSLLLSIECAPDQLEDVMLTLVEHGH